MAIPRALDMAKRVASVGGEARVKRRAKGHLNASCPIPKLYLGGCILIVNIDISPVTDLLCSQRYFVSYPKTTNVRCHSLGR